MARRVGYSLRQMRSGWWQVLIRDPLTGERMSLGSFEDKDDAEHAGMAAAVQQRTGSWLDPRRGEITLAEYLQTWLEGKRALGRHGGHGDRYARNAADLVRKYIEPRIGRVLLVDLTPAIVNRWHDGVVKQRIAATGKPGVVAAKSYRLMHAALADAVTSELIPRNPCVKRSAGVERSPERPLVEPEQITALADSIVPWWRCLVLVAGWCGLRFGEMQQLERRDVDLLHATIRIREAKTLAGVRSIHVPKFLVPIIEDQLGTWSQPGPTGRVFAGPKGGPLNAGNFTRDFRKAAAAVGLDHVRLHDLRHAAATYAAQSGATQAELMARIGHASPDASRRYLHAAERRDREVAARLDAMFEQQPSAQPARKVAQIGRETGSDQHFDE